MKFLNAKVFMLALAIGITAFSACRKDEDFLEEITQNAISSEDLSNAENADYEAESEFDTDIETYNNMSRCPVITFSARRGTFPQTVTIDYGTSGCVGRGGRLRRGRITITYSDTLSNANAVKSMVFDNFYLDSVRIEGNRTWRNNGRNAQGQPSFTRTVTGARLTYPDGTSATWESTQNVTQTAGFNTAIRTDDEFSVSGAASGVNRRNVAFSTQTTSPIVRRNDCRWNVSGVRSLTRNGRTSTLDYGYGGGNCDRQALFTAHNGNTRIVMLRQ